MMPSVPGPHRSPHYHSPCPLPDPTSHEPTDRSTDLPTDRPTDGSTDRPTDRSSRVPFFALALLQLKLVNHEADSSTPPSSVSPPPPPTAAATTTTSSTTTKTATLGAAGGSNGAPRGLEAERGALRSSRADEDLAAAAARDAERPEAAGGGAAGGSAGQEKEQVGEAMIDEAEYTEDHDEERRLFEGMQELLTVSSGGGGR